MRKIMLVIFSLLTVEAQAMNSTPPPEDTALAKALAVSLLRGYSGVLSSSSDSSGRVEAERYSQGADCIERGGMPFEVGDAVYRLVVCEGDLSKQKNR